MKKLLITCLVLAATQAVASNLKTTQICIHVGNIVGIAAEGDKNGLGTRQTLDFTRKEIKSCDTEACKAIYASAYHSIMMFSHLDKETANQLGYARCKVDLSSLE